MLALSGDFDGDGYVVLVIVFVSLFEYLITKPLEILFYAVEKVMLCLENVRFEILRDPSCTISV